MGGNDDTIETLPCLKIHQRPYHLYHDGGGCFGEATIAKPIGTLTFPNTVALFCDK